MERSILTETAVSLPCADGFVLRGTRFAGPSANGQAIVMASAMGVPRKFYAPLARYFAERGLTALTFDYRGIGDSRDGPVRGRDMRMQDWGRLDLEAALQWSLRELNPAKLFLLGHSAGGQLAGLAPSSARLTALVFAAVSSAYPGHWPLPARLGLHALMWGFVPLLSAGRDFYPSKATGLSSIPIPSGVTAQWARWARKPGYLFDPAHGVDLSGYAGLALPLLAWQFDDDHYATLPAHEAILAQYPNAAIERRRIDPRDHGGKIGHFGFFRERFRDTLWRETADWLLRR